jgi:hypothetical protein
LIVEVNIYEQDDLPFPVAGTDDLAMVICKFSISLP